MYDFGLNVSRDQIRDLLEKYFRSLPEERLAWQSRVMDLPGCDTQALTKLHGVLIAQGWVEQQNIFGEGAHAGNDLTGGYRITPGGVRAIREFQSPAEDSGFAGN